MLPAPPQLAPEVAAALPAYRQDPIRYLSMVASQGDVIGYRFGSEERVLVTAPADVHEVLTGWPEESRWTPITRTAARVMGDGLILTGAPNWRPRRLVIQRELTYKGVRRFAEVLARNTEQRLQDWLVVGELDLQQAVGALAFDNLGDTVFGTDFREVSSALSSSLRASQNAIDAVLEGRFDDAERANLDAAAERLNVFVQRLVRARAIEPTTGRDILGVFLEAVASGDPAFADPWLTDEAITLISAGHETTAFTVTMALQLLARERQVAARLRSELAAAVERGVALAALVDEVPLARQVIQETLRVCPPLPALHRTATSEAEIGGYHIPKGKLVVVSPYVVQHDRRSWPEPERFDPERFSEGRRRDLPRHAYLPFGAGARICAGNHFALLEAALIVAIATLRVDLEEQSGEPRLVDSGTALRCAEPLLVRIRPAASPAALVPR